ncbi:alpha/beta hydrolase [Mycobacterium hubeiense]|uniref:alpha/beta hydrolase n=1 Tax=Mycobacterium hubeiense TaxID=1867256 RepID=UPI000C7F601D|nr:alpha/beta hydrolase [Mycobacterium sp. QGD 101]
MNPAERAWRIATDLAGVLPRALAASPGGLRQLGEVALDELALTGMTLTAPPPKLERSVESCALAAQELSGLGVAGAHAEPKPLQVKSVRRRRIGRLAYEQVTFEHDPLLPSSLAGFGGPATAAVHLCRAVDERRPWLVWVHGAGQGQPLDLLFSRARRLQSELGFNIALPVQPGHGIRRNSWPPYPNMDPLNNIAGMMRAISEVRAVVRWLRPQSSAIAISGVSMGSPVAALVSHLETVDAVAVYTPIVGLNGMIAHHLGRWGPSVQPVSDLLGSAAVAALNSAVDHLSVDPTPPPSRRLIVGAAYDRMALREPALALHEHWGGHLYWHDGGHAGHLFSRRVQAESEKFLRGVGGVG